MNRFNFTAYLTSNVDISDQFVAQLLKNCSVKTVQQNEFLLQQGNICNHAFFVEQGLLRQYIIDTQGKEHIIQFAPENWFVTDRSSQYFQEPAITNIQAIEDSKLLVLDDSIIDKLIEENEAYRKYNTAILQKHIFSLQKRIYQLMASSAKDRYVDFIQTYPDILLRVPQTMVASYLGIAPESLSRVRKDLALQHNL